MNRSTRKVVHIEPSSNQFLAPCDLSIGDIVYDSNKDTYVMCAWHANPSAIFLVSLNDPMRTWTIDKNQQFKCHRFQRLLPGTKIIIEI